MKKSIKAAVYSGLIFPGSGHFMLKRYKRGIVVLLTAVLSLVVIVNIYVQKILSIIDRVEKGTLPLDVQVISNMVSAPSSGLESLLLNLAILGVIGCWAFGIIDSYRIGNIEDNANVTVIE